MAFDNSDTYLLSPEADPLSTLAPYDDLTGNSNKFENTSSSESADINILEGIFSLRDGVILNERWDNSYLLSGRINAISENFVSCELIIDKANKETKIRNYPIKQLDHLPSLNIGKTIKVKINEKPGSFRVDIIDGSNTGIEKEFESMSIWEELNDFEMDNPKDLNG